MTPKLQALVALHQKVLAAFFFATAAHSAVGQVRKYTGDPYIVHPVEVAGIVAETEGVTVDMIVAALLHDVVEDTGVLITTISRMFGVEVGAMVMDLTDYATPENFPRLNRSVRKGLEAERYADVIVPVKTIKLADGLSNTPSIAENDPGFLKVYGPEKRRLLESLRGGDKRLWDEMDAALSRLGY